MHPHYQSFGGIFNGMSLGNTMVVARAVGSRNKEKIQRSICYAFTFSVALGVFGIGSEHFFRPAAAVYHWSKSRNLPGSDCIPAYLFGRRDVYGDL